MQKKTRSLLEELQSYGENRDINNIIETRASNIITGAINLMEMIRKNYTPEKADLLEKKLLTSIKSKDQSKFTKILRKQNENSRNKQ